MFTDLETERLTLKLISSDDADFFYREFSFESVNRYLYDAEPCVSVDEAMQWIRFYTDDDQQDRCRWIIIRKDTGEKIGTCGFHCLNADTGEIETGYDLQPAHRHHGFMREAMTAALRYVFTQMKVTEVYAHISVDNTASARLAQHMGFVRTGRQYHEVFRGEKYLHDIYALRKPVDVKTLPEIFLEYQDTEWPFTFTDHDRHTTRGIVIDDEGSFYFVRVERDDDFGRATLIETSGGGVEPGESLENAIHRELREELGTEVDVLCKIGIVSDYYNLIHRHNVNHYYLCRIRSFGEKHLTDDELNDFHLSTLKMTYEEALTEYGRLACTPLGRLIAQREVGVLKRAHEILTQK